MVEPSIVVVGRKGPAKSKPPVSPSRCPQALLCHVGASLSLLLFLSESAVDTALHPCDPTDSLVSECLDHHKGGGSSRIDKPNQYKYTSNSTIRELQRGGKGGGFGQAEEEGEEGIDSHSSMLLLS